MDRLQFKHGLIALSGLAIVLGSSGCRDRNLRVPPPAHYTDGEPAIPEAGAYPTYPPMSSDPSAMDPYSGAGYGAASGTLDPATTPTSGVYPGIGDPLARPADPGPIPGYDSTAGFGVPPVPGGQDVDSYNGPYASASSPSIPTVDPYATGEVTDPYAGMNASAGGVPNFMSMEGAPDLTAPGSPAAFPGLDGGVDAPPIPDHLPEMP